MSDSEKSTLEFQSWVRNASRNWRAVYFCKISCTQATRGARQYTVRAHRLRETLYNKKAELTSMVMKFFKDLLIFNPSICRCPV